MAAIRGRNNKTTEVVLADLLRRNGILGWRRHVRLPGRPDFAFRQQRLAIFVDGCFWHGCPRHSRHVRKSGIFWVQKIRGNRTRDRKVTRELIEKGWRVVRIWEHELKDENRVLRRIATAFVS